MSEIWVDTDYGFDDLWALLLLKQYGVSIAGISLVAGNAPLQQVISNAYAARQTYGLDARLFRGAERPLVRVLETAERILGPRGMQSRNNQLPNYGSNESLPDAVPALIRWLDLDKANGKREVLAMGPLTNIAHLVQQNPECASRITRLIWMGGSAGAGNHSLKAEFNALADPEAAALVAGAGLPLDVIDLTVCRKVVFGAADMPEIDPLTSDLLGGYLDIGLSRGRDSMAIYDPVAAVAAIQPELFEFQPCVVDVSTASGSNYGATRFLPCASGRSRLANAVSKDVASMCLNVLAKVRVHGN